MRGLWFSCSDGSIRFMSWYQNDHCRKAYYFYGSAVGDWRVLFAVVGFTALISPLADHSRLFTGSH